MIPAGWEPLKVVAAAVGKSYNTIWVHARHGKIPAIQENGEWWADRAGTMIAMDKIYREWCDKNKVRAARLREEARA